jgi:hypothetical protein
LIEIESRWEEEGPQEVLAEDVVYDKLVINGVGVWLKEYHSGLWYRSDFNLAIKCDYITNNIAEMFNNWIKDHKDLPVCGPSVPPDDDGGPSSPPRMQKQAVMKKIDVKKEKTGE